MNLQESWNWLRDVPAAGTDVLFRAGPVFVWASQESKALCSLAVWGSMPWIVRSIERPHGLMALVPVPASIAGHSMCTTERA